ncbi:MAG: TspO/MBR family protein, partial [Patescibacteria group bacterium]
MKINNTLKLIISLIIPQLAGGLGSYFTIGSVKDWYPVLEKPALNPPAWIFGPVWTILFLLMGYALYLV